MARGVFICVDHYGNVTVVPTLWYADPDTSPDLTDIVSTMRPAELSDRIFFIRGGNGEVWLMKDRHWDHRLDGARLPLILTSSTRVAPPVVQPVILPRDLHKFTVYRTKAEPAPEQPFSWWVVTNIFPRSEQPYIRVLSRTQEDAEAAGTREGFEMPDAKLLT